jgi:hypothetical protein
MEQVVHPLYECTPCIYGYLTVRCMVWLIAVKGGGGAYPGTDALFSCDDGYELDEGGASVKCGIDGKYIHVLASTYSHPRCTGKPHPVNERNLRAFARWRCELFPPAGVPCETPRILHGRVAGGGGRFPGSNAHYTCDGGYSLVGSATTSCATNGASTFVYNLHCRLCSVHWVPGAN